MLLISIEDIQPGSLTARHLAEIAGMVGVMDMRQAYMTIEPFMGADGQTAMLVVDQTNYRDRMKLLISMAVINYACLVHEHFEVPTMEENLAVKLSRQHTIEECEKMTNVYLGQFLAMVEKYGI